MSNVEKMKAVFDHQLSMTKETWSRLVAHGATDGVALSLDFFFKAPSIQRARALQEFLEQETDYKVGISEDKDEWTVHGSTESTALTLAILEQWVDWMVATGFRFDAIFDGWGAEVG